MNTRSTALLGLLAATAPSLAAANEWEHTAVIYMIGASIDGTAGVGPVEGDVDISFSDILDNLEFGGMAAYRADNGPFAVVADLIYMDLETDKNGLGPFGRTRATVELDQLIAELDAPIAVTDRLDAYAVSCWLRDMDARGALNRYFDPPLTTAERKTVALEGWILGVT